MSFMHENVHYWTEQKREVIDVQGAFVFVCHMYLPYYNHYVGETPSQKTHIIAFYWIRTVLSLNALLTTETELKLMAAAAIIGLSRMPKAGYRIPAATGTPREL